MHLRCLPELPVLLSDVWIQLFGEPFGQLEDPDELEHVREVPEPVGRADSRGQLQLDQAGEGEQGQPLAADSHLRRIGKDHRFGSPVAGVVPGEEDVDGDVVHCVPKALAPWRLADISQPQMFPLELFEPLPGQEDVDVHREPAVTVGVERQGTDHCVGDSILIQQTNDLFQRVLDVRVTHEEPRRLLGPCEDTILQLTAQPGGRNGYSESTFPRHGNSVTQIPAGIDNPRPRP